MGVGVRRRFFHLLKSPDWWLCVAGAWRKMSVGEESRKFPTAIKLGKNHGDSR